jgi:hypothetical protein
MKIFRNICTGLVVMTVMFIVFFGILAVVNNIAVELEASRLGQKINYWLEPPAEEVSE